MRSWVLIIPVATTVKYSTAMFMSETVYEIRIYLTALGVKFNQGSQLQFPVHNILLRQFILLTDTTPTLSTHTKVRLGYSTLLE
jgi:hypothetical protein